VALITYAQQLKVLLEESKEQSLKQLQRALNKVELANKQLLEAEIHIGKVQHIVKLLLTHGLYYAALHSIQVNSELHHHVSIILD